MKIDIDVKDIEWDSFDKILKRRNLEERGRVQNFIGDEVARRSDKYIPLDTGTLKNSVQVLNGGKEVRWTTPYARAQYFGTALTRSYDPLRGGQWFERMKTAEGQEIINAAAKMAGGKGEK